MRRPVLLWPLRMGLVGLLAVGHVQVGVGAWVGYAGDVPVFGVGRCGECCLEATR